MKDRLYELHLRAVGAIWLLVLAGAYALIFAG